MSTKQKLSAILFTSWIIIPFTFDLLGFIIFYKSMLFSVIFTLSGLGLRTLWQVLTSRM